MGIEWLKREQENARRVYRKALGRKFTDEDFNHYSRVAYLLYRHCRLPKNASEEEKTAVRKIVTAGLYHGLAEEKFRDPEIRHLMSGLHSEVQKMASGHYELWKAHKSLGQTRNLKDFLEVIVKDPRIWLIHAMDKADRLINPPKDMGKDERLALAKEMHAYYSPLFHKLSLYELKNVTEDKAFEIRNPSLYSQISEAVSKRGYTNEFLNRIEGRLSEKIGGMFQAEIAGRLKKPFSIAQKMKRKGMIGDEYSEKKFSSGKMNALLTPLGDLAAFRIVLPSEDVKKCYEIRDMLKKDFFEKITDEEDYIAIPKANNYRTIHLVGTVEGKSMEVQIRTFAMHENAEHGDAAHWEYKGKRWIPELSKRLDVFREILAGKNPHAKLIDPVKEDSIVVKVEHEGKVLPIPFRKGWSLVELAHQLQKTHGLELKGQSFQLKGAHVNRLVEKGGKTVQEKKWRGKEQPLEHEDLVSNLVFDRKIQKPSQSLLHFVKDPDFNDEIRQRLKERK